MVRSPAGRLHVRTQAQFELEMQRIEMEVRCGESETSRLDLDSIFARAGYFTTSAGEFIEID